MTTTPTPTPSPVFVEDRGFPTYEVMEPIPEGGGTLTHQPGAEETVCNDTLPSILIPADHPDPNSVIEQIMEKSFRDALAQPDPGFPWETVGVTAAATLVLVAVGFAGYRFVQSRRDASRPAHTITGDES